MFNNTLIVTKKESAIFEKKGYLKWLMLPNYTVPMATLKGAVSPD
jgi:hypothetical protein